MKHVGPISGISSFAQKYVATAGYDNQILLWNLVTKRAVARAYHDHLVNFCTFSPQGNLLATASSDHTARIYAVPGLKLVAVLSGHDDDVEMVQFHPFKNLLATASRDHKIRIFDFQGTLQKTLTGHVADVLTVVWSSDGEELISTSDDAKILRWSPHNGEVLQEIDMNGVETDTLVITPAGEIIAGDDAGVLSIINPQGAKRVSAHRAGIKRLCYYAKSRTLVSLSYDRSLKLWKIAENGEPRLELTAEFPPIVWPRACAFVDEDTLVFGTFGSSYATFHTKTASWDLRHIEDTQSVNAVAVIGSDVYRAGDSGKVFKNDNPHRNLGSLINFLVPFEGALLAGGQSGQIFDAISGEVLHQHRSPVNCAAVLRGSTQAGTGSAPSSLDTAFAAIGTYTGEAIILAKSFGGKISFFTEIKIHENAVKGIAADGETLFAVSADRQVARYPIRDLLRDETPSLDRKLNSSIDQVHEKIANGCCRLPNSAFASISRDLHLKIWQASSVETFRTPLSHSLKCVAASKDGLSLAVGAYDGSVVIFDLESKSFRPVERPTASGISSLVSFEDSFLAGSYDGNVYKIAAAASREC